MRTLTTVARRLGPMLGQHIQLGHVVPDLDEALTFWTETLGVGPFVIIENPIGASPFVHRERDSDLRMTVAFSYLGDAMVELICQTNAAPSPYREFLASGRSGLHHIGFWPDDMEAAEARAREAGFIEVSSITMPDGQKSISYLESPPAVGVMIELIRATPFRQVYARGIRALAQDWTGDRPVRRFDSFAAFTDSEDCKS